MMQPAELPSSTLLSCTLPELCYIFWGMLQLTEPWGTLLSYTAPYWATLYQLSCVVFYWAKLRPAEIHSTLYEPAYPNWATLHSTELCRTLQSCAKPYWAMLYPTEQRCSLVSYVAPCELHYSLTELPSVLVPLCTFVKCQTVRYWNKCAPVW